MSKDYSEDRLMETISLTFMGPPTVQITGALENPIEFSGKEFDLAQVSRKICNRATNVQNGFLLLLVS